ncbi:unnamed protein product [Vitrella brassicaformis CCMP3155]|uniref:6,7-dimethyl-8-ribityllumazine synthase n=1 Tax=Vitrella brassicaformis (strain CCMP3155) TaxID=1169540 RepID=A0A0G4GD76_VITBC|nr:unnamed protein product [Vitrella brassicaformis CCMP3155]|eukprot:CEM26950.1 unnamed protein product [Vitrella brassicaformis CCMP3155]
MWLLLSSSALLLLHALPSAVSFYSPTLPPLPASSVRRLRAGTRHVRASLFMPSAWQRDVASKLRMVAPREGVDFPPLNGSDVKIGIIKTRWNKDIVDNLVKGVKEGLTECSVPAENILEIEVPGSYELPLATRFLALSNQVDAIVSIGVLIKGDTLHFEYIAESVSNGLMNVQLQTMTPTVFGVLTCLNLNQAKERSSGPDNHGISWGKTAVEMSVLRRYALGRYRKGSLGFVPTEESPEGEPNNLPATPWPTPDKKRIFFHFDDFRQQGGSGDASTEMR